VLNWIKEQWEWVVAGLVTILAFVIGRKGKQAAKDEVELKEKEIEVVNYASEKEAKKKSEALEKYLRETARLREEYKSAETSLKKETAQRKLELLELAKEDPDAIDKILMEEFNIARLK
tara:strand:- start:103 stop:459 length:357 start_codon:yes stop_codon:yes gene_type:complete